MRLILFVRSTSTSSLTHEKIETVLIEIEAILNARSLTAISSNPNNFEAFTPEYLIIGEPLTALID